MNDDWLAMLRSMEKRRDVDARFYKPVCMLAVIDGVSDGSVAPSDIDLDKVCSRFEDYVAPLFPDRATMGWRPFWHLSRDGAWVFRKDGRIVTPDDFRIQRKPNSRRELTANADHITVAPEMRAHWISVADRNELRDAVISMMERDDTACIALAAQLSRGSLPGSESRITDAAPNISSPRLLNGGSRQGFLSTASARRAVEMHAMTLAADLLVSEGWDVKDVSANSSYDLFASRGAAVQYVEVKGTTGAGSQIQITANEVAFARANKPDMRLLVVSQIALELDESGDLVASKGTVRSIENWAPQADELTPISYFCAVSG